VNALLNDVTETVHRTEGDRGNLRAECGATVHVNADHLSETTLTEAVDGDEVDKCGRCFDDGGGY